MKDVEQVVPGPRRDTAGGEIHLQSDGETLAEVVVDVCGQLPHQRPVDETDVAAVVSPEAEAHVPA